MGWRTIVISKTSKLDYKMNYLVIRNSEEFHRVFLDEIHTLIIESTAVSLTAHLLSELEKHKITVIFCDSKRIPQGLYVSLAGSHDSSLKVKNQVNWDSTIKMEIWKQIVQQKIFGQAWVLKQANHSIESQKIKSYVEQVEPGDLTNREGFAAKVYFNAIFGMDFTRDKKEDIRNIMLNYGYGILLGVVCREIVSNGYILQLGIHHDNRFNELNLGCDLMEPFRPYVDKVILENPSENFEKEEKHTILAFLNNQVFIDGSSQYLSNAITIYVKSVLDVLSRNSNFIKFPEYGK